MATRIDTDYIHRSGALGRKRRVLTVVACVAAVGWLSLYAGRGDQTLYSPGPVTSAHAQWEHNCAACHVGENGGGGGPAGGGFSMAVSDSACLKCHDAGVHHANQTTMVSATGTQSATCTACHVEHRGHASLAATSSAHCVQCHGDLASRSKSPPEVQASVRAFLADGSPGAHPPFGRSLMHDGQLIDPTVLKFNHDFHFNDSAGPKLTNCIACHSAASPSPAATRPAKDGATLPPWTTPKDRPLAWTVDGDRRYMSPISYQRHCADCHKLPVAGNVQIAHEDLSLVRSQLAALTPAEVQKYLPGGAPSKGVPGRSGGGGGGGDAVAKKLQAMLAQKELPSDQHQLAARRLDALERAKPLAALAEFHVAYTTKESCVKCHAVAEAAADAPLAIVPTGIPDAPRRWYANSRFDHDAHRNLSCVDCHAQAITSSQTSDVLLPGIRNCASCHQADRGPVRGAPANCATCHWYHERTREPISLRGFVGASPQPAEAPPPR
ncbi:MAG TPA: cytochrome c3 family protein [Tepidisphaeraceae bacterium]|nr:cytochrome c3 family protein [Tepidisphaeraceae bacterium]